MPVSIAGVGEHHHEILGGEVAARRRGERRAAEAAERRVEAVDTELDRGPGVEQGSAAGVVEVQADVAAGLVEDLARPGVASPSRSCRRASPGRRRRRGPDRRARRHRRG